MDRIVCSRLRRLAAGAVASFVVLFAVGCSKQDQISKDESQEVAPLTTLRFGSDLAVLKTGGEVRLLFPSCKPQKVLTATLARGPVEFWRIANAFGVVPELNGITVGRVPSDMNEVKPFQQPEASDNVIATVIVENVSDTGGGWGASFRWSDLPEGRVLYRGEQLSEAELKSRLGCVGSSVTGRVPATSTS